MNRDGRSFFVISRSLIFLFGIFLVLSLFNFANVGDEDVISLQSSVSSITALSVYEPVSIPAVYESTSQNNSMKSDLLSIEKNTYLVTADDIVDEYEAIDVAAFSRDGSSMWICVNLANLRSEPSIDADIIDQLEYSTELLRVSYGNSWSMVRLEDGTEGFIFSSSLSSEEIFAPTPTPTNEPTVTSTSTPVPQNPTAAPASQNNVTPTPSVNYTISSYSATLYASCALNVRSGPGINFSLVRVLNYGAELIVTGQTSNGWYQLSDGNFVKADLCTSNQPQVQTTVPQESTGNGFSDYCRQFLGTNYVYGGSSPSGFDCSGFVLYVYANYYGISLPHNAAEIALLGTPVSGDVQVGDVLCHDYNGDGYIEHCSIYIGNGQCIHASNSRSGVILSAWPMGSVVTIRRFV